MKRKTTKKIVLIIISILIIALVAVCVIFVVNNKKNKLKDNALQNIISEIRNIGESSNKGKEYIAVSTNGKWGYIDKNTGKEVISCKYDKVGTKFSKLNIEGRNYYISIANRDDIYYLLTSNGNEIQLDLNVWIDEANKVASNMRNEYIWLELSSQLGEKLQVQEVETEDDINDEDVEEENNMSLIFKYNEDDNCYEYKSENCTFILEDDVEEVGIKYILTVIKDNGETEQKNACFPVNFSIKDLEKHEIINEQKVLLYSDGYIPYYDEKNKEQGYYNKSGDKFWIKGNYQILDVRNDIVLLKNIDENLIYFIKEGQIALKAKEIQIIEKNYLIITEDDKMLVINENIEPLVEEYDYIYEFDENILFGANTLKNGKVESDIFTSNGQMITTKKYEMVCNSNMYIDKDEWSGELWSGFWVMDQYYEYFMEEE